jgi:CRISPR-associated protein Cas1
MSKTDGEEWTERGEFWGKKIDVSIYPLVLAGHGISLRISHGALEVAHGFTHYPQPAKRETFFPGRQRRPSAVVVLDAASGSVTFDAMFWLAEQEVPLIAVDYRGETVAMIPTVRTPALDHLRTLQRSIAANPRVSLALSRALIVRKLSACRGTLQCVSDNGGEGVGERCNAAIAEMTASLKEITTRLPRNLSALRGIEGRAAAAYFGAWRQLPLRWVGTKRHPIPETWHNVGPRTAMPGEGNRNATHPVQAMLNYGYGLLEGRTRIAITTFGLDPAVGFMHSPARPKEAPRSPLALDLMESLRPIVDAAVLGFVSGTSLRPADFVLTREGVCRLHPQLARVVVARVSEALSKRVEDGATWLVGEMQQWDRPAGRARGVAGDRAASRAWDHAAE